MRDLTRAGITALCTAAFAITLVPDAHALNKTQRRCQETIAKHGGRYLRKHLKLMLNCANENLEETGSCNTMLRTARLQVAEAKLKAALQKRCGDVFGFEVPSLAVLGFPGKCRDADPSDGFTAKDLKECIFVTHRDAADALFELQYGGNSLDSVLDFATRTGDPGLAVRLRRCQKEIGKNGRLMAAVVQKQVSKCRDALSRGKLTGFAAVDCADNPVFPKTGEKIATAASKARVKILAHCADGLIADPHMDVCDVGSGRQMTEADAGDCIVTSHTGAIDDPDDTGGAHPFPVDIIDIEYALGAICGDGITNDPAPPPFVTGNPFVGPPLEECDRSDDEACPGLCGAPDGDFPCLCSDVPRLRVVEHDNGDLDRGWSGLRHDQAAFGGSYVLDLHDCDGPAGPDTTCTLGPSCALAPHGPCGVDSDCPGGGNLCRKTAVATGPYCSGDLQRPCTTNADCPSPNEICRKQPRGAPVPLSGGGVSVCSVNIFAEDVTGTIDLTSGDAVSRVRELATIHLGLGTLTQPCPVCGGFCAGASGGASPGARTLCGADSDCPASATCVLAPICSYGPNEDQPCRTAGPFGNPTGVFGTTSVDCPPAPGSSAGTDLDITYHPTTTGALTTLPAHVCNHFGFTGRKCILGSEVGKACIADSDCASGGAGSCAEQCFCPGTSGTLQKPNDCFPACRGGTNDYGICTVDSDCPGGLCEQASCRAAAGVCTTGASVGTACLVHSDCGPGGICSDDDSSGEGFCPTGPLRGRCSVTPMEPCFADADCRPSGGCVECAPDESETCVVRNLECFPSTGYVRTGTPGFPERIDVAHFCVPGTGIASIDVTAGLVGPGALELPVTVVTTP